MKRNEKDKYSFSDSSNAWFKYSIATNESAGWCFGKFPIFL